jgi:hypothetical protein
MEGPSEPDSRTKRRAQNRDAKARQREKLRMALGEMEVRRLWREEQRRRRRSKLFPLVVRERAEPYRLFTFRGRLSKRFATLADVTDYVGVALPADLPPWATDVSPTRKILEFAERGVSLADFSDDDLAPYAAYFWAKVWANLCEMADDASLPLPQRTAAREARMITWRMFPALVSDVRGTLLRLCGFLSTPGFVPFERDVWRDAEGFPRISSDRPRPLRSTVILNWTAALHGHLVASGARIPSFRPTETDASHWEPFGTIDWIESNAAHYRRYFAEVVTERALVPLYPVPRGGYPRQGWECGEPGWEVGDDE